MSKAGSIARGLKWKTIRDMNVALDNANSLKQVKWIDSQQSIVDDIKAYEDTLVLEEPEETPKKKVKKR